MTPDENAPPAAPSEPDAPAAPTEPAEAESVSELRWYQREGTPLGHILVMAGMIGLLFGFVAWTLAYVIESPPQDDWLSEVVGHPQAEQLRLVARFAAVGAFCGGIAQLLFEFVMLGVRKLRRRRG